MKSRNEMGGEGRGRRIRIFCPIMASLFLFPRSAIFAKRLLKHCMSTRLLTTRSFFALENRSFSQFLRTVPIPRSRVLGQTLSCSKFCSAAKAGIIESKYTVEVPEQSLSEFVMSEFHERGDDIAMVSLCSQPEFKKLPVITTLTAITSVVICQVELERPRGINGLVQIQYSDLVFF